MAKQLNKKLVVALTIAAMVLMFAAAAWIIIILPQNDPQYYVQQAIAAGKAGEHLKASRLYGRAWKVSNDPHWMVMSGQEALEAGDTMVAMQRWRQAIAANPKLEEAQQKIVGLTLEIAKLVQGVDTWNQVLTASEALLAINKGSSLGLNARGLAKVGLRRVKEEYAEQGLNDLMEAHRLAPENPDYADALARYYEREGATREEKARSLENEAQSLDSQGQRDAAEARRTEARQNRTEAAGFHDKADGIYRAMTVTADNLAATQPAEAATAEAGAGTPQQKAATAHRYYGQYLMRRGKLEESRVELEKAIALAPKEVAARAAFAQYWIQRSFQERQPTTGAAQPTTSTRRIFDEHFQRAEAELVKAMEIDPDDYTPYLMLGALYAEQGDLGRVTEIYEKRLARPTVRSGLKAWGDRNGKMTILDQAFRTAMQRLSGRPEDKKADDEMIAKAEGYYRMASTETQGGESDPFARAMKGRIEAARGNVQEAIKALTAAVEGLPPDNPKVGELQYTLGDLYMRTRATGLAAKSYETAARWYGNSDEVLAKYASALQENGDARALPVAERALQINPQNRMAKLVLRSIYRAQKNEEKVAQIDRELGLAEASSGIAALLVRARDKYVQAGGPDGDPALLKAVETDLREALQKEPANAVAVQMLVSLLASTQREKDAMVILNNAEAEAAKLPASDERKETERVIRTLKIRVDPQMSAAEKVKAQEALMAQTTDEFQRESELAQLYARNNDLKKAVEHARKAASLRPKDGPTQEFLFQLAMRAQDDAAAKEVLDRARADNLDGVQGRFFAGNYARSKGDLDGAIREYRAGLELNSASYQGQTLLGDALMQAGRLEEAQVALSRALEINPNMGAAHVSLGRLAEQRNQRDVMLRHLARARELVPQDAWVQEKVQAEQEELNPEKAIAIRERGRKEMPTDPQKLELFHIGNLLRLGELYARIGKNDQAEAAFREAIEKSTANDRTRSKTTPWLYARFLLLRKDKPQPERGLQILKDYAASIQDKDAKAEAVVLQGQYMQQWAALGLPNAPKLADIDAAADAAVAVSDSYGILMGVGGWYQQTGRTNRAEEFFRKAIQKAAEDKGPDAAERQRTARRYLLSILAQTPDMERRAEVNKEIQSFVDQYPNDAFGLLIKGQYCALTGRENEAIDALTKCLQKEPSNAHAAYRRGYLYFRQQRWDAALADLQKAKSLNPSGFNYQHRIVLAGAEVRKGQTEAALSELESILREDPSAEHVAQTIVELLAKLNRIDQAEAKALEYRTLYPTNPFWPLRLATLAESRAVKNPDTIIKHYRAGAELSQYRPDVVAALLQAMLDGGHPDQVIDYVTRVLPADQRKPSGLAKLAQAYLRTGQEPLARKAFDEAFAASKDSTIDLRGVSDAYQAAFGYDALVKTLTNRLASAPKDRVLSYVIGAVLMRQADQADRQARSAEAAQYRSQARERLQDALASATTDDQKAEILRVTAQLLCAMKEYDQAVQQYEQILKLAPEDLFSLNNLAYTLMTNLNKPKEALEYSRRAAGLLRDNANVLDTYGWNLTLLGQYAEALGPLGAALDAEPDNALVLYHRAITYRKMSEDPKLAQDKTTHLARAKDDALRAYQAAVKTTDADTLRLVNELLKDLNVVPPATQAMPPR